MLGPPPPQRPPFLSAEQRERARARRHKRWLGMLSERDWARMQALARQVTDTFSPARLDDLDAQGIAVGVCQVGSEDRFSGEKIGTIRDGEVAVLVWQQTESDRRD